MSIELYDVAVPIFRQGLTAFVGIIDKAEAYCAERKVDPSVLINDRLYPDMLPFAFQAASVLNHSIGAVQRLKGGDPERIGSLTSFADIKEKTIAAIAELDHTVPEDLAGAADRKIDWKIPGAAINFTGLGYLRSFAIQNFMFHLSMAYAILRHRGVDVGKSSFMGPSERLGVTQD